MTPAQEARLLGIADRFEITELSHCYARAQDRLDPAMHRAVFHDDAWLEYGFYRGGPDDFVRFAQTALATMAVTQHLLGQITIDLNGDEAFGEVYMIAYHRVMQNGAPTDKIVAGRYVDRYERRGGAWKIAFRTELVDWARTDPASEQFFEQRPDALRTTRATVDTLMSERVAMRHPRKN